MKLKRLGGIENSLISNIKETSKDKFMKEIKKGWVLKASYRKGTKKKTKITLK